MPVNRWTPEGELHVFNHISEVPEGLLSKHPDDPNSESPARADGAAPVADGVSAVLPMERAEIAAALNAENIEFSKNAKTPFLYAKLRDSLVTHLTEAGREFDPEADAKVLLGLVSSEA